MRIQKHLPKLGTLAALIILAACSSDSATAISSVPDVAASPIVAPPTPAKVAASAIVAEVSEAPAVGPHGTFAAVYPSNAVTYVFTHDPRYDGAYQIGEHLLWFPFATICDPAVSSYGPGKWLDNCSKATKPIKITATTWRDAQGRAQIDFSTALRFYYNSWSELPAIYLMDASAASMGRIDYCVSGGPCVNEAASDPVLATMRDPYNGWLFRLIRHFSGYNVWA